MPAAYSGRDNSTIGTPDLRLDARPETQNRLVVPPMVPVDGQVLLSTL